MKKLFTCNVIKWFDKLNGNTYHSVRITRHKDGKIIVCPFEYGYGEQYKYTALNAMVKNKWINPQYEGQIYLYERENNYPIIWIVTDGLKRDCISNGVL